MGSRYINYDYTPAQLLEAGWVVFKEAFHNTFFTAITFIGLYFITATIAIFIVKVYDPKETPPLLFRVPPNTIFRSLPTAASVFVAGVSISLLVMTAVHWSRASDTTYFVDVMLTCAVSCLGMASAIGSVFVTTGFLSKAFIHTEGEEGEEGGSKSRSRSRKAD